jgi:PHD/YefM family antitoxin component YafN of YafNO toxin-antitoxin module
MQATYRLRVNELGKLIEILKNSYADKEMEITVQEVEDETDYLLSNEANRKHLERSFASIESGKGLLEVSLESLEL